MPEKAFNISFVQEVKMHRELYDYTFKNYGKEDVTNKAWCDVAIKVKLTVNECKVKWNNLLSAYISNIKPTSSSSGRKNKKSYYYITEAMEFMLPLVNTSGTPIENLPDCVQQPKVKATQCRADSTQNLLDMIEKVDVQPVRHVAIHSVSPFSPVQPLKTSMPRQKTDSLHENIPNYVSTLNTTPKTGKSQKRTFTDVDGSLAEFVVNCTKNKKITVTSSESNKDRKTFLLSLLPKITLMTDLQMSLFERGVKQIIDDIINPRSYLQLSLPSIPRPTGSLMSSTHSSLSMDQYSSTGQYLFMGQYSSLGQYPPMGQYPTSLPTDYQMSVEQQRHNYTQESKTFTSQDIFSQSFEMYSPRTTFPQSFGTLAPQIMNNSSPNFEHFHTEKHNKN